LIAVNDALVGGAYLRNDRLTRREIPVAFVKEFEEVAAAAIGGHVFAARGDERMVVAVVLQEDELIGRRCPSHRGYRGDEVAQSAAQPVHLGVMKSSDQFGVTSCPQDEPAGDLHAGPDLGCPQVISEDHRLVVDGFHSAYESGIRRSAHGASPGCAVVT
jgi:hypothetical protein